jgi:hypothetical protein
MKESLAVVAIDRWEVVGAIASAINALASLAAISFVAIQLKSSNRIAQAQLINELERDISLDTDIYVAIGGKWLDESVDLSDADRAGILRCISFFERVNLILETRVVDISIIDRTFAGRFFILFNNPKVQSLMNTPEMKPYMTSIVDLHRQWCEYRKEQEPTLMDFKQFSDGDIQEVQKNAIQ